MSEPKPIASLSGILLARKGLARPAMRRPSLMGSNGNAALSQDDLGWNDMGYDVDPDPNTPMDYDHSFHGQNRSRALFRKSKASRNVFLTNMILSLTPDLTVWPEQNRKLIRH